MKQSIIALKNVLKISLTTALLLVELNACNTMASKKELPMETTDKEIIQLAQQAFNNRNYKLSNHYYNVLLQRYGNNTVDYVIGTFETAHIAIKNKDYDTAVPLLNEVLEIYKNTPSGELPAAYRVLAQNDLNKIPEQKRSIISASGRNNDYYENDDYGDTDFFGIPPSFPDDDDNDDDYSSEGDYSNYDSYWY